MAEPNYINGDFNHNDFDGNDFFIGTIGRTYNFFFKYLPVYYKMNDTYKDLEDRGLLERYLDAFDPEVLEEIFPGILNYLDNIDVKICKPKFLIHLSDILGNPPDIFNDVDKYRNLLAYIVSIYKIKGSIESYELFFDILGFNVEIYEVPLLNDNSNYDNDGEYDSLEYDPVYDKNICQTCSYYDITLYYKDDTKYTIDIQTINSIREAIKFNEPINARLRSLTIGFNITDTLNLNITDADVTIEELNPAKYDLGNEYDEGLEYEQP